MKTLHSALAALAMTALLASCGASNGASPDTGPPPTPVTVAKPLSKPILDWDEYVGRFEAKESVELRPRVSGYVQSIAFREGQFVKKGQVLFVIDPRPFQAAVDAAAAETARAKANAALAEANYARGERLMADRAISQEELDTLKAASMQGAAAVSAAKAQERARRLELEFTRVTAPIAGRASDRRLSVGNYVSAGQTTLTSIVSLDPIHFVFDGSEAVYLKYQRANRAGTRPSSRVSPNPVEIRLQDEPTYRWRGKMDFVDNQLDPSTGSIRGRAVIRNPDGLLTPGMYGHMRLLGSGAYTALLLPDDAIVTDQDRKLVFVAKPGGAIEPHPVILGPTVDGLRVVRSGVSADDEVIIEGVQRIRPGIKIAPKPGKITPPAPGEAPAASAEFSQPPAASATAASER